MWFLFLSELWGQVIYWEWQNLGQLEGLGEGIE